MAKKAREDEIEEAAAAPGNPSTRKRKRTGGSISTSSTTPGTMCDDVLRSIFARVPARTAVASMALSTHHRRLMRCPDFRALHCRLAPPLPRPHIAYVATAGVRRSSCGGDPWGLPVSGYHSFHVAGGGGGDNDNAPMRSLVGPMYLEKKYVNTCNGVVLLANVASPTTCVLWNPAVTDEEKEVTIPVSARDDCAILGLGYGPSTNTYKLLLTCRRKLPKPNRDCGRDRYRHPWSSKELLVYTLGVAGEQPRLRTLVPNGLDGEISGESLYIGGIVYLLHLDKSEILAFDADDETVTTINLPGECHFRAMSSKLLVVSGRPCVDVQEDGNGIRALWLLTAEHQWEMRCTIDGYRLHRYSIAGAWECGGVLLMYLHVLHRQDGEDDSKLFMYCNETKKKLAGRNLPLSLTPGSSHYALCWGYKPTLVAPGSIVGELNQDGHGERRRDRTTDIMAAMKPVNERDRRKGQEETLDTVCFMDLLLRIMRALSENMQDVIGIPLLKPEDSGSGSHSSSDSDSGSGSSSRSGSHSSSDSDSSSDSY